MMGLMGCSNGPSTEAQSRDAQEQKDAAKKQAQFFNQSPPPLEKPGQ
jgi:hypothetical protein